jgi:signal transduction histidine kinase
VVRRKLWLWYLAAALVIAAVYLWSGSLVVHAVLITVIGVSSALATFVAIVLWRPERRILWVLVGVAQAAETVGTALFYHRILESGAPPPLGSANDPFWISFYVLFSAALIMLLRRRGSTRAAVLDAALLAVAGAVPTVLILIEPYISASGLPALGKAVQIASALGDVVLAAVFLRLVASGARWSPASFLLLAAAPCFLASDFIWNWLTLLGNFQPGSWADAGWLLAYIFTGAASLHPSMVRLGEVEPVGVNENESVRQPVLGRLYLLVLGAALLVSPGLHVAEKVSGRDFGSLSVVALLSTLALLVLVRVAGTVRESERLRLEVAEQNQRLLQLDKMKDEFVASVSHELRTPLTSIRGYLELIRDDKNIDEEQKKMLSIVDRNADRLLRLVSDLLFVAQREDAEIVGDISELDLMELAREGVEGAGPQASTAGVTLELHGESAFLQGDPSRLSQVIDNLISNAIKFTPAGGQIDVRVDVRAEQVILAVSDTGMGVPKDEQADLFQRFFRTRGANAAAIQGTGLGLSIVKEIVESHGGTIGFTSREGLGTTFTVELPGNAARPLATAASTASSNGVPQGLQLV